MLSPWQVLTLETREAHRTIARSRIRGRAYDDFNSEALVIPGRVHARLATCTHITVCRGSRRVKHQACQGPAIGCTSGNDGEGEGSSICAPQQSCECISDVAGHRPVAAVTLGTSGDDAPDRATKEMQAKFRHIVLYKESDEIKFHVLDPDNIALDLTEDQPCRSLAHF